jgi:hypothetical protein
MTARTRTPPLDATEFGELHQRLRRGTDWGPADRRGALNHLTQAEVLAAAGEVSWSFLCVIAPLRLHRGTGSPVNPIAIV